MTRREAEIADDIARARQMREDAERSRELTREVIEREGAPIWRRLELRKMQNSFGEEYELSLIPRRASS